MSWGALTGKTERCITTEMESSPAMMRLIQRHLLTALVAAGTAAVALSLSTPAYADTTATTTTTTTAPAPSATPQPFFELTGAATSGSFNTTGQNALGALDVATGFDRRSRTDITNMLLTPTFNVGHFHATATGGFYDLPTLGCALNPTTQRGANTSLFSALPLYAVSYTPDEHLTFSAGKLHSLLGQEGMFTFQNFDIQRGMVWEIEPLVSHGVRGAYANGPLTVQLEENDGYYGGWSTRGYEGAVSFDLSDTQSVSFAMIDPHSNAAPNPTAEIANKHEETLDYTARFGKLALTPYLLWIQSPAVAKFGYSDEKASAGSLLGEYSFSPRYSLGARYEDAWNASALNDPSGNADLIGYGPGSSVQTYTLTPAYHAPWGLVRLEWSSVYVKDLKTGLGFGADGTGTHQNRYALEFGLIH